MTNNQRHELLAHLIIAVCADDHRTVAILGHVLAEDLAARMIAAVDIDDTPTYQAEVDSDVPLYERPLSHEEAMAMLEAELAEGDAATA